MMQYNRHGLEDVENHKKHAAEKPMMNKNIASILRLFLAIMVFVVIVLYIAK